VAIPETIDSQIEKLIGQLGAANDAESVRIRDRINELKALKKEHTT